MSRRAVPSEQASFTRNHRWVGDIGRGATPTVSPQRVDSSLAVLPAGILSMLDDRSPIRVVVGEDQALFREGLVHVLKASGFDVVATTGNADDLVRKARAHSPDVVVADIQMPPGFDDDGIRAAR